MNELHDVLDALLDDARTSFSVGCLGAIAEFHWSADEPSQRSAELGRVSARGHLRVDALERHWPRLTPVAWLEGPGHELPWRQSFELVLPEVEARGALRSTITRVAVDDEGVWFDLGLGATNVDAFVIAREPELIAALDAAEGTRFVDDGNAAYAAVKRFSPARVFRSAVAEIRVDGRIPSREANEATDLGPHTHVLRGLLAGGARPAAFAPARPTGCVPVLAIHPPHPVADELGRAREFDADDCEAFDRLLRAYAPRTWLEEFDALCARAAGGAAPMSVDRRIARPLLALMTARGADPALVATLATEWNVHAFATEVESL